MAYCSTAAKIQILSSGWRINYLYQEFFLLAFLKRIRPLSLLSDNILTVV
ncbi:hypothetical protein CJP42_4030 [Salmonella enterica subsp. enterica serovar Typhi]|nr:hypothetical protein CJP42_4030 [Salmonella enterica subsp. enterica serovar Typhi]